MTIEEYKKLTAKKSEKTKFHSQACYVDGIFFPSKREAKRYGELKLLQKAGNVVKIELQVRYDLLVNSKKICAYIADFRVTYSDGKVEVEDTKGVRTPLYLIKKKLMEAIHNIKIKEI